MNNNLEDLAVVTAVENGFITVQMKTTAACGSCGMSGFCHGKDQKSTHNIHTDRIFKIGDVVRIEIKPALRIYSALSVFLLPILFMITFYCLSRYVLGISENISILLAFLGLFFGGFTVYLLDKKFGKKIKFEIIEKVER